jgi:hypothetical protein
VESCCELGNEPSSSIKCAKSNSARFNFTVGTELHGIELARMSQQRLAMSNL